LAALVAAAVVLLVLDYHGQVGGVRSGVNAVAGPVEGVTGSAYSTVSHSLSSLASAGRDRRRVEQLTTQNAELKRRIADLQDAQRTANSLAALDLAANRDGYQIHAARVIAAGAVDGFGKTVTVNAGSSDGVKVSQLVVADGGLAGTTVQVDKHTSVVRLINDPKSHIGARLAGNNALGTIDGSSSGAIAFTLFDNGATLTAGTALSTFGSLDYVAGVPIGKLGSGLAAGTNGLTHRATVKPIADLGSLDLVGIVVGSTGTNALAGPTP
jgi:rod shape-determining protein MreC